MKHLLVTNDFPPKHGGIQSYLWELWRRLPPEDVVVVTTPYAGDEAWDRQQPFRVVRLRDRVLLPTPQLARTVDDIARQAGAELVVLDPALPLGLIGRRLALPYAVVLHGAEVTVPGRLPASRQALAAVLRGATHVVAAGSYPAAEGRRAAGDDMPPTTIVPPGVDVERFRPLDDDERRAARESFGLAADARVVLGVSRLVPRKGFDVLIQAAARMGPGRPDLVVAIAGDGRDRQRLERMARERSAPVQFLGRVPDDDLPALYGCADVFAMLCRNRWGGLEQEGFGIVFVEAAASGIPQVAGNSGGSAEAVADGVTGIVVNDPRDVAAVTLALLGYVDDGPTRVAAGRAARTRAIEEFSYGVLVERLRLALDAAASPP